MIMNSYSLLSTLICFVLQSLSFFFFNDTATTEIYTLSLHDALPISSFLSQISFLHQRGAVAFMARGVAEHFAQQRSEEHTSELQSPCNLVCRLLLEKKKKHVNHVQPISYVHVHILSLA